MNTSAKALAYIRTKETLALTAYRDGGGVLTIGWGHTGADVHEGDVIDLERAMVLFRTDVSEAESEVRRLVNHTKTPLTQSMWDALVSFEFNCGGLEFVSNGKTQRSRLLRALDDCRYCDAVEELVVWNNDGGRGVRGLLIRRLEEGLMFASEKFPVSGHG